MSAGNTTMGSWKAGRYCMMPGIKLEPGCRLTLRELALSSLDDVSNVTLLYIVA